MLGFVASTDADVGLLSRDPVVLLSLEADTVVCVASVTLVLSLVAYSVVNALAVEP